MKDTLDLWPGAGSEVNPVKIGGVTELLGDPRQRREKPHTIIRFPGGAFEIARTDDNDYWVHVSVKDGVDEPSGLIIAARLDATGRYADDFNGLLREEIAKGDVSHIAFLIRAAPSSEGLG